MMYLAGHPARPNLHESKTLLIASLGEGSTVPRPLEGAVGVPCETVVDFAVLHWGPVEEVDKLLVHRGMGCAQFVRMTPV